MLNMKKNYNFVTDLWERIKDYDYNKIHIFCYVNICKMKYNYVIIIKIYYN